jgi:hypothetical protein
MWLQDGTWGCAPDCPCKHASEAQPVIAQQEITADLTATRAALKQALWERDEALRAQPVIAREWQEKVREAFRAGFIAHPAPEAEVFTWSFDPGEWSLAADREESAWEAYLAACRLLRDEHEPT